MLKFWGMLTNLGKFVASTVPILIFAVIFTVLGGGYHIILIFMGFCSLALIWSVMNLVYDLTKDRYDREEYDREVERERHIQRRERVKPKVKRVFSKEDPYGEENWEN